MQNRSKNETILYAMRRYFRKCSTGFHHFYELLMVTYTSTYVLPMRQYLFFRQDVEKMKSQNKFFTMDMN